MLKKLITTSTSKFITIRCQNTVAGRILYTADHIKIVNSSLTFDDNSFNVNS